MYPLHPIEEAKKNIIDLYKAVEVPKWFGWSTKTRLRNCKTNEFFNCSPEKFEKILNLLLNRFAIEKGPLELSLGKKKYICYRDEEEPTFPHIYKIGEFLGKGGFSQVFEGFAITLGKPCAYKVPFKLAQPSPPQTGNPEVKVEQEKDASPVSEKEPIAIQLPAYVTYGESENLEFLMNMIESSRPFASKQYVENNQFLESLLPQQQLESLSPEEYLELLLPLQQSSEQHLESLLPTHNGAHYVPFVIPLDKVKWPSATDLVFELADKSLDDYLSYGFAETLNPDNIWQYTSQLLQILKLFEAMQIVHTDVKSSNMVLQEGKLKLIDFDVLVKLPPDNKEKYVRQSSVIRTRLYFTKACKAKFRAAKTNAEARRAWLYSQRVAFAHTISEILRLTPLTNENEVEQNLKLKDKQYYTELDITKMLNYQKFPDAIKKLLETLLDKSIPPINDCIDALNENIKNTYITNTFKLMQNERPEYLNGKYA